MCHCLTGSSQGLSLSTWGQVQHGTHIEDPYPDLLLCSSMSHPDSGDQQLPLWVITGSHSWGGSLQAAEKCDPVEWTPDGQLATLSLDHSPEETIDLGDPCSAEETPGRTGDVPQGEAPTVDSSWTGTCRDHGQKLSLFCYQEYKLICPQCKSQGTCLSHRTKPAEERAAQIRNKIVDQCERLQLQTSGIEKYLADVLPAKTPRVANSENEMDERAEEAEGILEPQESEKLNFNMNCVQSPLLNRLWATSVLCCTTACEDLTFDEKTLSPMLALGENNSLKFLQKKAKTYPDGPERFDHWPNCMVTESFHSGIHMWKVNVEKTCAYKLGITYRTIARKGSGNEARLGYNPVSWIFSRYDKDFRFSHDSQHQLVELLKSPKHISVLVDIDGGELIFFDPDSCVILYSHQTKFSAPISPVFAVADESISLEK
ncbi:B box and SPRY domain-containing protein isoform X2 [Pseudophryne corroboree]|uniref:B box and SPRY domain-containing protein isoform X2 n=1 Tax=Pseudophryne corroboree TaxID=495146 RepID=UPI00308120D1